MKKIRVAQKLIIFLSKTQLDVSLTRAVKSGLSLLCGLAALILIQIALSSVVVKILLLNQ